MVRLLVAREDNLREVVRGLATYTGVFADIGGAERLPDGSTFAYFKNFLDFTDVEALLCRELQAAGDASAPLLEALATLNTPLDCDPNSEVPLPNLASPPPRVDAGDAQEAVDQIFGAVGQVDGSQPQGLDALLGGLLGAEAAGDETTAGAGAGGSGEQP